jgi:hypothetical protein
LKAQVRQLSAGSRRRWCRSNDTISGGTGERSALDLDHARAN